MRSVREAAPGVRSQLVQRVLQAECGGRREPRLFAAKPPERPYDIEVDLAGIWGDPDSVIAAVRDALAAADIDPGDFLEAVRPAVDDDDELLITCRAWVHVDVGGRTSAP